MQKSFTKKSLQKTTVRKADQYNDPKHNYLHYWDGRDYEHAAEEMAIKRLLRGKHFKNAADIGGGYGRLCLLLKNYATQVTLAEPSRQQLDLAKGYLVEHPDIDQKLMQADDLKFKKGQLELITMIRVMHHLPEPSKEFAEISRVLADNGVFILEVANNAHARNRIKYTFRGRRIPPQPVDIRSKANRNNEEIPFVNHNPKTVVKQLAHAGLKVEKVLSVSNLRSPALKKVVPKGVMLKAEWLMQSTFSKIHFGPSIFFMIKKAK